MIIPKNIVIKTVEATILSLKIDNQPGNSISSIVLSSLPPYFGANLLDNHSPTSVGVRLQIGIAGNFIRNI